MQCNISLPIFVKWAEILSSLCYLIHCLHIALLGVVIFFWYTILNNEISEHSIECYIYKFAYGRSIIMGFPIVAVVSEDIVAVVLIYFYSPFTFIASIILFDEKSQTLLINAFASRLIHSLNYHSSKTILNLAIISEFEENVLISAFLMHKNDFFFS